MLVMKILDLNFKEPRNKVLNLKLGFNNKTFWRTGVEVYFLYKLHLIRFPRSLRPAFPTSLLDFDFPTDLRASPDESEEYFERLKERLEYFFEAFFKVCGHELEALEEFQGFLDDRIQSVVFSKKELDASEANILPVKEWFPATSRFIRSSLFRIRQRSPSPHLEMDAVDMKADSFADEKRLAMQRVRLADLEPTRTDLIQFRIESAEGLLETGSFFKDLGSFDQRKDLLEKGLKHITYLGNTLSGCGNLLASINQVFCEDSTSGFFDMAVYARNAQLCEAVQSTTTRLNELLRDPLQVQMDDVYSLVRGFNERIFALKAYDTALVERGRACESLDRVRSEAIEAMDRAQGSLSLLTTSSTAFDRKIAAKNAEIEKRIRRVEGAAADFAGINRNGAEQFSVWEQITDSYIMNKIKLF